MLGTKDQNLPKNQSLLFEVLFTRPLWRILILACSLMATLLGLTGPFFQKEFIDALTQTSSLHTMTPSPLPLLLLSFFCLFLSLGFSTLTNFLGNRESILLQRKLAQRIYDHALNLRTDSLHGRPVGEIVSIYATDVPGATMFLEQSIPMGASILFPLILTPWALFHFFELPLWPTLILMGTVVATSFLLAYRQSKFFFLFKKLAADRIGLVSEWIQNIRTLRILGWTRAFEDRIFQVRKVETENRIAMLTNGQTMNSFSSSITFLLNISAIGSLVYLSGKPVTTGTLMALMWIIAIFLTRPFRQLPWFFTFVFDAWTSLKRLEQFFALENFEPQPRPSSPQKIKMNDSQSQALQIKNLNLEINRRRILTDVSFSIRPTEFVTIVGEVGSGKSLLLLSLLGETGASFSEFHIGENDALKMPKDQARNFFTFVPQEGFIMSASLRENVAFEYGVLPGKLDHEILASLDRSQFKMDLERVDQGLETEIGERGVNLSGGQKQRVSLARVDYYNAPIVLLDDCLSAVDVDTENKIIEELINGAWKNRTRLLVTHRLTVLEKSDRVIFLEGGKISALGKFKDLVATHDSFRQFVSTVAHEESKRLLDLEKKSTDLAVMPEDKSEPTHE